MKSNHQSILFLILAGVIGLALMLTGCSKSSGNPSAGTPTATTSDTAQPAAPPPSEQPVDAVDTAPMLVHSSVERIANPTVDVADLEQLVTGSNAFAFALYGRVAEQEGNIFLSPYSISAALAMAYAGARGETAEQMKEALHFSLGSDRLHAAFNALDRSLMSQERFLRSLDSDPFQLTIANALWGQSGYSFLPEFLDLLSAEYGAGVHTVNFRDAPAAAREEINTWARDQTRDKIPELLGPGMPSEGTRLVLTNAVYFSAAWALPFEEALTAASAFTTQDGTEIDVPMMKQTARFGYAEGEGVRMLEMGYENSAITMTILLPDEGAAESVLDGMTIDAFAELVATLSNELVAVQLPKFTYDASFSLSDPLQRIGMPLPFRGGEADFSGMDGTRELFIGDVIHKAFVAVDEQGTEAAAATAVIMVGTGIAQDPPTPIPFVVNRPFLFAIRDAETGTILFIGRVMDPRE